MKIFLGFLWLGMLLGCCFFSVYIARRIVLSAVRREVSAKNAQEEKPATEAKGSEAKQAEPSPVYYIVEKRSRKKNTYSKPRRIHFD